MDEQRVGIHHVQILKTNGEKFFGPVLKIGGFARIPLPDCRQRLLAKSTTLKGISMKTSTIIKTRRFQRRTFLKAAGVSIALPTLESLTHAAPSSGTPPMRMVCISSALGMNPQAFFPTSFDDDYELSPTLRSLTDLRNDFTVFSHMDHPGIYTKHGAMNSLLSGIDAKKASAGENFSMDQVAAAHVGYQTRFPSVHISLGGSQGASWTASGIKVREESDPLDLFRKLFVNDPDAAKQARKLELDQQGSVLDLVRGQAT